MARLRFVEGKTEPQIRNILADRYQIIASVSMICRDIQRARTSFQLYYGNREKFDAAAEVAKILARYEFAAMQCLRRAREETDNTKFAQLMRVFNESNEKYTNLLQHVGLVDKRLGTLFIASSTKAEAVPTGTELQKLFDDVNIVDGEIISEAERAWLYGDAAAAESAANAYDSKGAK